MVMVFIIQFYYDFDLIDEEKLSVEFYFLMNFLCYIVKQFKKFGLSYRGLKYQIYFKSVYICD